MALEASLVACFLYIHFGRTAQAGIFSPLPVKKKKSAPLPPNHAHKAAVLSVFLPRRLGIYTQDLPYKMLVTLHSPEIPPLSAHFAI